MSRAAIARSVDGARDKPGSGPSAAEQYIDKYVNAIAEPSLEARRDPRILARSKATQSARHRYTDAYGFGRERMPMGVIVASYFLRAGKVCSTSIGEIVVREPPASGAGAGPARRSGDL